MATEPADPRHGLLEAGISLSAELSLDALLQRAVETAAGLTGARYAALGVIDQSGRELERFLFTGIEPALAERIGELPRGRGILGALIRDARPLLLDDLGDDPRSVGFPPHHPPMRTFLGVPILMRGRAYGNLYLTEKETGPFTESDRELVETLASQVAVAIENARLYEAATQWSRQLEALNEVSDALLTEIDLGRLLALIAERLRDLIDAELVLIARPAGDGLRIEAGDGERAHAVLGTILPAPNKLGRVLERQRPERVDSMLDDPEVDVELARTTGGRSALFVPLVLRGRGIGVIAVIDRYGRDTRFSERDSRLAETFASRAAAAVDLSERVAGDSLRRVVEAQELERRRLARELHDGTGQELTSILLGLKAVEDAADESARRTAIEEVRRQVIETLHEVRRLAVELRPKALDDFGLEAALERLQTSFAEGTGMHVAFEARLRERLPSGVETALYRIVQEALTNVVKHAQASSVSILVTSTADAVSAVIDDDGRGFSPDAPAEGMGLVGMRERLALLGGSLSVESKPGGGTTIAAHVPLGG